MRVTYYVEDGYVGTDSRPHTIVVNDSDLEDMNHEQKVELIEEKIRDHFNQTISWYWDIEKHVKTSKQ